MTHINRILDAARKAGAQQAEVYQISNEETPVRFEANRLKELNSRHTSGVALRVIANGRIGFASSTRPGDVEDVVRAAMDTAPFGPRGALRFPLADRAAGRRGVTIRPTEAVSVDDMIQIGQTLIDAVASRRAGDPLRRAQCDGAPAR